MNVIHRLIPCAVTLGALLSANVALADALPPAAEDCSGNGSAIGSVPLGGACNTHDANNTPGTCQSSTCSGLNYSCDAGPDATHSGPCGSTSYACVMCISGTASATDGGGSTGSGSDGGGSGSGSSKSGGCAVTGGDTSFANILVPLGLASLFSLAMRGKKKKQA